MFREYRPLWAEINIDNLENNIRQIKSKLGDKTKYISVIKADAYGHGAIEVAKVCIENGINDFAVAMVDEALELRGAGIDKSILILGYTPPNMADIIVEKDISQACFTLDMAKAMSDAAVKCKKNAEIHIAVDTGMGWIGFSPDEKNADIVKKISMLPNIEIEGIFTHFSTSDEENKEFTKLQYNRFNSFLGLLKERGVNPKIKHAGNSASLIDLPELKMDAVRVGIIQYGLYPSEDVIKDNISLKPVMSVKTNVVYIKEVDAGTPISYGRRFITKRKSKIATLPVGYADGYSRMLFGKAKVILNGRFAPVVGNICMDQCMIDITDLGDIAVGDEVIIMGGDKGISILAEDLADLLGTINYEVLCMFSKRVPRVYYKGGSLVSVRNYLINEY
mgnify:CR=1 FL=1